VYEPVPPIFVFADDWTVYPSLRDAERDYEPLTVRVIEAVYDARGVVLAVGDGGPSGVTFRSAQPPAADVADFRRRLRDRLAALAEARPGRVDGRWAREASGDELVRWCAANLTARPR
jgi:hypothetical protein